MEIMIAFSRLADGNEAILRGAPTYVKEAFKHGKRNAKGGKIPFRISGPVATMEDENKLWQGLVLQAMGHPEAKMVWEKYQIWIKRASDVWDILYDKSCLCYFMRDHDSIVIEPSAMEIRAHMTRLDCRNN